MKPYVLIRTNQELDSVVFDYSKPVFCDTETKLDLGVSKGGLYGAVRLVQCYQKGMSKAIIID